MFAATKVAKEDARLTTLVPLKDRVLNQEAMVISFIAENNISMSSTAKIVELAQALAEDKVALQHLACSKTTTSYKLKFGVAATFHEELIEELKGNTFSLNIDEAMNSNNDKVITVLVSHFSEEQQMVTVNHLSSFSLTKVTSENLYQKLVEIFELNELPWANLLSIMMDSCAVMRGKRNGLETLVRERKAPHLLDVDGDTCHHAHNAAKEFCKLFGRHVEQLLNDLHTDHKWATYNRDLLGDICLALGIAPSAPKQYVPHRWLSLVEVVADTLRIMDALIVFYYSFLPEPDQKLYQEYVKKIYENRNISKETMRSIEEVQLEAKASLKSATRDGKDRKKRITQKLFDFFGKTMLQLNLYISVLSILHKYIKIFQTRTPMMHELHPKQEELVKEYLQCFIRPEYLVGGPVQLLKLDLDQKKMLLPSSDLNLGSYVRMDFKTRRSDDPIMRELQEQAKAAFITGGKKLLEKMPLNNKVLRCFSCLDPRTRGTTTSLKELTKLPGLLPGNMTANEEDQFQQEVRTFQTDKKLPQLAETERIDTWWGKVGEDRYPVMKCLVKRALSCFHGPLVESVFSVMGQIIDKSNTSIDIETYSAMQTVKLSLKATGKTSVQFFKKNDPVKDHISKRLVQNMKSAAQRDKDRRDKNREEMAQKAASLGVAAKKLTTKRKATEDILDEARQGRECSPTPSCSTAATEEKGDSPTPAKNRKQSSIGSFFSPISRK